MPHHCTVCKDTVKPACFHRGHVTICRAPTCKLVYQSSREKDCPYCRNATQKRAAREGSIPKDEGDDALTESAGGDGSDKENAPPSADGARAQKQQKQQKKKKKKKGKHVRETRRLKDIRRGRRLN
ncbi:uncharacterized protein BO66DRAFT_441830 [Aspergillus aculeatinus CBS 121060]|uniref:Uncharacterized protein n=1 Tax=Aspergillus aculeatinus CBS 121060 TaxID=1448322 RepID=A0ACD1GZD0_9EURO|nr:hypothetical protein BO66DRAFT_441830 [Aspergillus aculeatinus CBS 121060]RAH66705.1 hypothetical protein BO66DRAFT_441830 [Aspergillus aculeatinus CBS 121060]